MNAFEVGFTNLIEPCESSTNSEDGFSNFTKLCGSSLSELRNQIGSGLSESVVAVTSFVGKYIIIHPLFPVLQFYFQSVWLKLLPSLGGTKLFECTGTFIENLCADATSTSVLTSADICGSPDHVVTDDLMVGVANSSLYFFSFIYLCIILFTYSYIILFAD